MNRFSRRATLAAVLGLAALSLACNRPSKPVARVNESWVGQDRWTEFLKAAKMDPKAPKPQKEQALKSVVRREVAAELALKKGLDKEVLTQERRALIAEQTVVYQVLQDRIDKQPALTDKEIQDYFYSRTEERRLKHVLCTTEAEGKACVQEIQAGKPFKEVLSRFCTDKEVLKAEGDLGFRGRGAVPAKYADAIFEAADGAVLGPFEVPNGWEVVVVVDRKAPAESTFALQKDNVVAQMTRERADRLRREVIEETQKKYSVNIRQDALPSVLDPKPLPADAKTVVATVGKEPISLAELKAFVQSLSQRSTTMPSLLKADLGKYITMMSGEKAVLSHARETGVDRRKDVKAKIWNIERDHLAAAFGESYLREAPVTKEALQAFFSANEQNFRAPNEAVVRYFQGSREDDLRKAVDELRRGTPLAQVQKKYSLAPVDGGQAKPFDFSNPPAFIPAQSIRAIGTAPEGAWIGVFSTGNAFLALEVVSTKPGAQLTFEEAGDRVRTAYLNKMGMQLLEGYLDGEGQKGMEVETFPNNL